VPTLVVSALSTFDNKGLKKAKKEVSAFDKQLKTFAKTFATAFSVTALTRFGKAAVKAFAEDEKAARSLEQQLKNTGFQFSSPSVELYIANLQKTTGVLDDELRPAFQQLLTVTGSITTSQDALNTALNISAATGKSLTTITTALSRGYAGNTTGLSRLGAGLDKNLLKTGDMNKIMGELNTKFSGQAAARLETYAGKMSLLSVAAADAQEIIGKGILDALTLLSEDNTIEGLTNNMQDFATATSEVIYGLAVIGDKLKQLTTIPGLGSLFDVRNIPVLGGYIGGLQQLGRNAMPQQDRGGLERTAGRINAQQRKLETQIIKSGVSLRKAENDQLKKKTAVDQLRDKFDIERIGLTAALNAATDDETKLRLKAQLAILDNNEALAKKLLAEMNGTTATEELTKQFYALSEAARALLLSFGVDPSQIGPGGTIVGGAKGRIGNLANTSINNPSFASSAAGMDLGLALGFTPGSRSNAAPTEVIVTVNTANSGDRLSQAIAETIQIATRSGYSTVPAGFL
jgi:hypothetical protein